MEKESANAINQSYSKRNKSRKFVRIVLSIFVGSYIILCTSKLYLPQKDTWSNTPINTVMVLGSQERTIKLIRWDYSKRQRYMEVELDIKNSIPEKGTYNCNVIYTENKKEYMLPASFAYQSESNAVIHIKDVPNNVKRIKILFAFMRSSDDYDVTTIYTDKKTVQMVDNLTPTNEAGYQVKRKGMEKQQLQTEIKENDKSNSELNEQINALQEQISSLELEREYKTSDELIDLNADIAQKQSQITSLESKKQSHTLKINECTEKINELDTMIAALTPNIKEIKLRYE